MKINKKLESITTIDQNGNWIELSVGDAVLAKAFGHWYQATVVSFGRKLVKIEYTSGAGVTRQKNVTFGIGESEFKQTLRTIAKNDE